MGGVEVSSVLSSSTCGWHNENDVKISIILIARKTKMKKKIVIRNQYLISMGEIFPVGIFTHFKRFKE